MKPIAFFVSLSIGLGVSNMGIADSDSEKVLYCADELATGFAKENGEWKEKTFQQERYTVKIKMVESTYVRNDPMQDIRFYTVEFSDVGRFRCQDIFGWERPAPKLLDCVLDKGFGRYVDIAKFNLATNRY